MKTCRPVAVKDADSVPELNPADMPSFDSDVTTSSGSATSSDDSASSYTASAVVRPALWPALC